MSETTQVMEQNSSPAMPIPAVKQRRSNKAPAVKAAVLVQRASGIAKRKIARDLGITRPTVDVIIAEANLDQQIETGQLLSASLIPDAVTAVGEALKKKDGNLGLNFLKWQLGENPNSRAGQQKALNAVFSGCQVLIQQAAGTMPAGQLHQNAAEPSTNSAQQNIQVIANQQDK